MMPMRRDWSAHVERAHQPRRQVRTQARLDLAELGRRPVGGEDDAAVVLDQRGQRMEQLFLRRRLAADEMDIVDQQQVGAAHLVLEGGGRLVHQRLDEGRGEFFGRQVDDAGVGTARAGFPADGVQQVRLAVAVRPVQEHRIEVAVGPRRHLARHLIGEFVAAPATNVSKVSLSCRPLMRWAGITTEAGSGASPCGRVTGVLAAAGGTAARTSPRNRRASGYRDCGRQDRAAPTVPWRA